MKNALWYALMPLALPLLMVAFVNIGMVMLCEWTWAKLTHREYKWWASITEEDGSA